MMNSKSMCCWGENENDEIENEVKMRKQEKLLNMTI